MKPIQIIVENELHRKLKVKAATEDRTVKEVVISKIKEYVNEGT